MITMNFVKFMKLKLRIDATIGCPTILLLYKDELLHLLVQLHQVDIP
jgi:hypothetical protein